jgi:hypothetical protein
MTESAAAMNQEEVLTNLANGRFVVYRDADPGDDELRGTVALTQGQRQTVADAAARLERQGA